MTDNTMGKHVFSWEVEKRGMSFQFPNGTCVEIATMAY